jgi:hypothetical protein
LLNVVLLGKGKNPKWNTFINTFKENAKETDSSI